jgi:uncharacterized protein YegL
MPKLGAETDMQVTQMGQNFSFSGVRLEKLTSTEYTLASIAIDTTGSVSGFSDELLAMLKTSILSLKKSPRAANLLVRVILFNTAVGEQELHGFKPLSDIHVDTDYQPFQIAGATNLFDAAYSLVGATSIMGEDLMKNDFLANGIIFVITDGGDNASRVTPSMIKTQIEDIRLKEKLESLITLLVGVNAGYYKTELDRFKTDGGFDKYIDMGDATPQNLAKLAGWVSQSVSSQSQSLGTGGPSQQTGRAYLFI